MGPFAEIVGAAGVGYTDTVTTAVPVHELASVPVTIYVVVVVGDALTD